MSDLSARYMGIPLRNPVMVAASPISHSIEAVKQAEDVGAGALVTSSLFEEQVQYEQQKFEESLAFGSYSYAEVMSYFPRLEFGRAKELLLGIETIRKAVKIPIFASLNAVSPGSWLKYARQLESTGVDGLELNVYSVAANPAQPGTAIEQELFNIVTAVKGEVNIPVAVKLSPFYTSTANVAAELDKRSVAGLVLFNRFLQPTIDIETEQLHDDLSLSSASEMNLPLRWTALLYGRVKADLALTSGVQSGQDAIRAILAGATVVQVARSLLIYGLPFISTMLREIETWMARKGYQRLDQFQGKVSQQNCADPFAFERAQYVQLLLTQAPPQQADRFGLKSAGSEYMERVL